MTHKQQLEEFIVENPELAGSTHTKALLKAAAICDILPHRTPSEVAKSTGAIAFVLAFFMDSVHPEGREKILQSTMDFALKIARDRDEEENQ